METRPPALIEALVGWLTPAASREHVLGDLRERSRSTAEFVANAARTVPFVVASQMRRTLDWLLMGWEAFVLCLVFRPSHFEGTWPEAVRLLVPLCGALAGLAIRDAYRRAGSTSGGSLDHIFEDALKHALGAAGWGAVAAAVAFLIGRLAGLGDLWLPSGSKIVGACLGGFLMLIPLRVGWRVVIAAGGYRRLVDHEIAFNNLVPEDRRRVFEQRRDTLRTSWLWFPALAIVAAFASSLFRYAEQPVPLLVEGATTLAALLLLRGMANRIASLLQRDIDAIVK